MTIHNILHHITEPGELLTSQQIITRALNAHPERKSVDPSQHVKGKPGKCKQCHTQPLFEHLGHGLYRVLPKTQSLSIPSIHEKLAAALAECSGQVLSVRDIRQRVTAYFPDTPWLSVNPFEHRQGGACSLCNQAPLLHHLRHNVYQVLPVPTPTVPLPGQPALTRALGEWLRIHLPSLPPESAMLETLAALPGVQPLDVNLLATAWREEIVLRLLEFRSLTQPGELMHCLGLKLQERHGIRPDLSYWAVTTWAEAIHYAKEPTYDQAPADPERRFVADIQVPLMALELEPVLEHVYRLKKNRRRIGVLIYPSTYRWLGVRREIARIVLKPDWGQYRRIPDELPVTLPLSNQELATYAWYAFPADPLMREALVLLDQSFR